MKKLKRIPKFKNEAEEREFWQTHDSTEYVAYKTLENWRFPNLKLTSKPITLRLPVGVVPYQSLIKQFIFERIAK